MDGRFLREQQIFAAPYTLGGTTANLPRNPCLDTPFPDQRFEEAAAQGYCTVHRHPLFVEYIEVLSELLMSVLQRADAIVDIPASKAALAVKPTELRTLGICLGGGGWNGLITFTKRTSQSHFPGFVDYTGGVTIMRKEITFIGKWFVKVIARCYHY